MIYLILGAIGAICFLTYEMISLKEELKREGEKSTRYFVDYNKVLNKCRQLNIENGNLRAKFKELERLVPARGKGGRFVKRNQK